MLNMTGTVMKSFRPPTGVNHYEWKQGRLLNNDTNRGFRPPTGVNHYELEMIKEKG